MTAVLVDVPCTQELLDQIPIGGRIVRDYYGGGKTVIHRTERHLNWFDWRYGLNDDMTPGAWMTTVGLLAGYGGKPVTVHTPAPMHVAPSGDGSREWWCNVCQDTKIGLDSIGAAIDDACAHIANHVEIAQAL